MNQWRERNMVQSVEATAINSAAGTASSTTGLAAQYARLQRQLADWECCSSAKTPEGKAKIKEISDKVKVVETRLVETQTANSDQRPVLPLTRSAPVEPSTPVRRLSLLNVHA
jgi:hypothetical protein